MLNKETIAVLQQLNAITNSVILRYPQTVAVSESQDMMVMMDFADVDEPFPEIPLRDSLSDLIRLFGLFSDDRQVRVDENVISITSGDSETASTFIMDNPALMGAYDKDPEQFAKTESVPSVAQFVLTSDDMKNIKAASGVFKDLSEVIFAASDDSVTVSLGATNKFNARSNTYSVNKRCDVKKAFDVKVPVENFRMIPQSTYEVHVKYNSARDAYRILLVGKTLEGFKILMSVKA